MVIKSVEIKKEKAKIQNRKVRFLGKTNHRCRIITRVKSETSQSEKREGGELKIQYTAKKYNTRRKRHKATEMSTRCPNLLTLENPQSMRDSGFYELSRRFSVAFYRLMNLL